MMDVVHIDGSQGEGGGQIVRSSLALSMVTGLPVSIERVRAGRERPGLMRQHLTAVHAAQQICQAEVTGDAIGSDKLTFHPGTVVPRDHHFAVGTAGSATLVLQTVLPPLLLAGGPSRLILEGGTHNPWAPSFDFLNLAFLPLVNRMGPRVTTKLERPGFYPAGGGRFIVTIEPQLRSIDVTKSSASQHLGYLSPFDLLERGETLGRRGRVLLSNLPEHIAQRECTELSRLAEWCEGHPLLEAVTAIGPGNAVVVELESEHVTEVFVGIGEYGVKAETVVKRAIDEMRDYLVADVPVGPYLADQLMLAQGIAVWQSRGQEGHQAARFRTGKLTNHSRTHLAVLKTFLGIEVTMKEEGRLVTVALE